MADATYLEAVNRFAELFQRAQQTALQEPAAVTLATVAETGQPAARVVLLRGADVEGFVFFTNSLSDKGRHLSGNPKAALCFYWDPLKEQVRVEGTAERVSDEESDVYWQSRAHESQIGAWASLQSKVLSDRSELEQRFANAEKEFADRQVPRPNHWHGYRVVPTRIEFWSSRPARLHERVVYEQRGDGWTRFLLYP